jgi:hypothetical protein
MEAMIGGIGEAPDFGRIGRLGADYLPLPTKEDGLPLLAEKVAALGRVVYERKSLVVATGQQATRYKTTDPLDFAKATMSVEERRQYDLWTEGARVRRFVPETSKEDVKKWKGNEESLLRWLAGMQEMYDNNRLVKENVVWWAVHLPRLVPTITAHYKITSARRGLLIDGSDLSPMEVAEYQTAKKIVATIGHRVQEIMSEIARYNSIIKQGDEAVQTRVRFYERRAGRKDRGKAPLNKERAIEGLPSLDGPSSFAAASVRKRPWEREDLGESRRKRRQRVQAAQLLEQEPAPYVPQSPRMDYGEGPVVSEGGALTVEVGREVDTEDIEITGLDA